LIVLASTPLPSHKQTDGRADWQCQWICCSNTQCMHVGVSGSLTITTRSCSENIRNSSITAAVTVAHVKPTTTNSFNVSAYLPPFRPSLFPPANVAVVMCWVSSAVYLSVCLCPVRALTSESLDLETSLSVRRYVFRISRSSSYMKVVGSRSKSQEQTRDVRACTFVGGRPSIKMQACFQVFQFLFHPIFFQPKGDTQLSLVSLKAR